MTPRKGKGSHKHPGVMPPLIALLVVIAIFLALSPASSTPAILHKDALQAAYQAAVADAKIAEPDEVSRQLIAIRPDNPRLVWQAQSQRLLVLTWTDWNGYDDKTGQSVTATRPVWVTTAPELQQFCRANHALGADLPLRLEQLLGLPPSTGKNRFVELWVRPASLFRPSADPEITDHEAEPDFLRNADLLTINPQHVHWYNELKTQSYVAGKGYPWTRLGYSYDWGNPDSEVGLSEFVIKPGSDMLVHAVSSIESYCKP